MSVRGHQRRFCAVGVMFSSSPNHRHFDADRKWARSANSVLRRCPRYVRSARDSVHESGHHGTSRPSSPVGAFRQIDLAIGLRRAHLEITQFNAPKAAHKTAIYRNLRSVYRQHYQSAALMPSAGKQSEQSGIQCGGACNRTWHVRTACCERSNSGAGTPKCPLRQSAPDAIRQALLDHPGLDIFLT